MTQNSIMKKFEDLKSLNINSTLYKTRLSKKFENRKAYEPVDMGLIESFIPRTVVDIFVKEGQDVVKGEILLILEAMKMQNKLKSPVDGKVTGICVEKGAKVPKGALLMEIR